MHFNMKKFIYIISLIILYSTGLLSKEIYTNQKYCFSIEVPDGRVPIERENYVVFIDQQNSYPYSNIYPPMVAVYYPELNDETKDKMRFSTNTWEGRDYIEENYQHISYPHSFFRIKQSRFEYQKERQFIREYRILCFLNYCDTSKGLAAKGIDIVEAVEYNGKKRIILPVAHLALVEGKELLLSEVHFRKHNYINQRYVLNTSNFLKIPRFQDLKETFQSLNSHKSWFNTFKELENCEWKK